MKAQEIKYKVHRVLYDDAKSSWVWMESGEWKSGDFVAITYIDSKKTIVVKCRVVDEFYKTQWLKRAKIKLNSDPKIYLNFHYRNLLKIDDKLNSDITFRITTTTSCYHKYFKFFRNHPDPEVRILLFQSVVIGIGGIILGVLGTITSIYISA